MEAMMPSGLSDLFSTAASKKARLRKAPLKKTNKKNQAKKTAAAEIQELVWLKKQLTLKLFFTIVLLSVVTVAPFYLSQSDMMPVEKIRIQGAFRQLDTERVKMQLEAYLGKGFFSVDIKSMQQKISHQPWVKSVSIKRVWPAMLNVDIVERTAFARWDDKHLLSDNAVIFEASSAAFSNLPLINGFAAESDALMQRYQQIQQRFKAQGLTIREMREDRKGAIVLRLDNQLLVKLGSDRSANKIEHFLAVYPQVIKADVDAISTIDFRYSNGFAIAWKEKETNELKKQRTRSRGNV